MASSEINYKETFFIRNFGLKESFADSDGLYNGCLCPPDQALCLYWASYMGLFSGFIGIYNNHVLLGMGTIIGSFFAQNYWANPKFCWRRNIDMFWIQILIWSHLYSAIYSQRLILYLCIQALGILCYGTSWWFHKIGVSWGSTIFHFLLHLCANSSLIVFYTS